MQDNLLKLNQRQTKVKLCFREFPGRPVAKTEPPRQEAQVQPQVGELRSHMPRGTAKKYVCVCVWRWGFPREAVVKNSAANAEATGDAGSIFRSGRSPGGGNGNPLRDSCLRNPTDRGAWRATVRGLQSQTQLSNGMHVCVCVSVIVRIHTYTHTYMYNWITLLYPWNTVNLLSFKQNKVTGTGFDPPSAVLSHHTLPSHITWSPKISRAPPFAQRAITVKPHRPEGAFSLLARVPHG